MTGKRLQTNPIETPTGHFVTGGSEGSGHKAVPGLVLMWKPSELVSDDRASLMETVEVGRSSAASWCIQDRMLSRRHFSFERLSEGRFLVKDLGSKNGTFVNAARLESPREVEPGAVVQAGNCVFLLYCDLWLLASPGEVGHARIAGRFHAAPLVRRLRVAARTGRHIMLEGESGSGKELAAQVIHEVLGELGRTGPLVALNAACFAGEDDAVASLIGVSEKAFTGVTERKGALTEADGGTLFLDEVHNLPARAQRTLLRFSEDGTIRHLGGDSRPRHLDIRLILGTNNLPVEKACEEGVLANDLVARLHRVEIPALRERKADIPSIFEQLLRCALDETLLENVTSCLDAMRVERLCLHDYRSGNVRELEDLIAVIRARIQEGEGVTTAVSAAFDEAFGPSPRRRRDTEHSRVTSSSVYERHRVQIIAAYKQTGDNLSSLEKTLREQGIMVNRRWLASYLDRWGVRKAWKRR